MKNQSRTIKTNPELYRVVMGGSGGYRRLPGGSDHFSLQTNRQTLHHNIYIITITIIIIPIITLSKDVRLPLQLQRAMAAEAEAAREARAKVFRFALLDIYYIVTV